MTTPAAAVAEGQAAAAQLMTDSCIITVAGAAPTFNPTTGDYDSPDGATVYTGGCRVRPSNLSANTVVEAGDRPVSLWPYTVSVPVTVIDVELGHLVTITSSADPSLVNRRLRVRSVTRGTHITARRLDCEEEGS